jgi:hypothetical protein
MARNYIPTMLVDVHKLNVYFTRYGFIIRPAVHAIDPELDAPLEALIVAVSALDAAQEQLRDTAD